MQMRSAAVAATLLLVLARGALAGELSTITLRDGSVISGEILFMGGGVYTVRSTTLGTITIAAADVRTVSSDSPLAAAAAPAAAADAGAPPQIEALQQRLASDPETMKDISALQDSPEIQAVLEDPEIQAALRSGDVQALMSNPKIMRLAADPRLRRIVEKVQ